MHLGLGVSDSVEYLFIFIDQLFGVEGVDVGHIVAHLRLLLELHLGLSIFGSSRVIGR